MKTYKENHKHTNDFDWEVMYVQTEHWKDESSFFDEEFQFLHNLIGGFLVWLSSEEDLHQAKSLVERLNTLSNQNRALARRITGQMIALEELQNGSFTGDELKVKNDAVAIRATLDEFITDFRSLKKEIHYLTKILSKTEKLNRLKKT
ncbi:MAG: hypothetical protein CMH48_10310 [Muricauda sp.]|nr:hypothetical protein [Allomuricauda sp.]MAU17077.1 hypothetical protein [Allomuricauda sp.]MBC31226.1 hypothetical protein [Allomuricauda sp.]|tara:strand:+ start:60218 stop:60661 length:444 start_codon:yes stop_codon:yes gene_type:complete